jgi:magnesium-protoporphyrin O-methyltransferase
VELAAELPPADIVTLDAVICCYPYLRPLLREAVTPGPRLVGLVFPHDAWWMRVALSAFNIVAHLLRRLDHYHIRRAEIDRLMAEAGLVEIYRGGTRLWRVVLYAQESPTSRRASSLPPVKGASSA